MGRRARGRRRGRDMLFLVSLFHLPLANATAINMTSPLIISRAGRLVPRASGSVRRGGSRSASASRASCCIIQPQAEGFDGYALVCVLSTVLLSVRDLVTRRVHAAVPSILVTLSNTVAVTLLAGALSLFGGWRAFTVFELGYLAVVAVFLSTAYYLIVVSTRRGDLSLIAPFRYTALLFATIAGFVIWGDKPNALAWGGIALVIASGNLRLAREPPRATPRSRRTDRELSRACTPSARRRGSRRTTGRASAAPTPGTLLPTCAAAAPTRACSRAFSFVTSCVRRSWTWIRCQPNGVRTGAESSPGWSAFIARSKSGTVSPGDTHPRSPPFAALASSELAFAWSSNFAPCSIRFADALDLDLRVVVRRGLVHLDENVPQARLLDDRRASCGCGSRAA